MKTDGSQFGNLVFPTCTAQPWGNKRREWTDMTKREMHLPEPRSHPIHTEPLVLQSVPPVQRLQWILLLMTQATSLKHTWSVWSKCYWNKMPAYDRILSGSWKSVSQMTFEELCFCMEMGFGSIKCHSPAGLDFRLKTLMRIRCCAHLLCTPRKQRGE